MADLPYKEASQLVSITGSDATGAETNPVNSSANGELNVSDISNNGGVNGAITVGITAVEAYVSIAPLVNRVILTVFHNGSGKLYWGLSNAVTSSNGTQIFKNTMATFDVGPNTHIWLVADIANQDIRIGEFA